MSLKQKTIRLCSAIRFILSTFAVNLQHTHYNYYRKRGEIVQKARHNRQNQLCSFIQ